MNRLSATLQKALDEASASLPVLKEQVERQGIGGMTDAQWRENTRRSRIATARNGMVSALDEMGSAVNAYFTPEERLGFAQFAETKHHGMTLEDQGMFAVPLAVSAALADQESRWRFDWMLQHTGQPNFYPDTQPFVDLERRRGRFAELGPEMEQLAERVPVTWRSAPLLAAADAYRSAGDEANELRVLTRGFSVNGLDTSRQQRYFQLLLERQPQELVRLTSVWPMPYSELAADYVVAHGSAALAHAVVEARGKARPAVWNKAYNALVGLYFAEPTPEVNNAFLAALGDDPIGMRLARPVDRSQQLAGSIWFYYGSRYGEYLGATKLGDPEDFLPAILEESPASASGYLTLADYYSDAGDTKHAIADYNHALELSPNRPDVYDSLALAYHKQGDRAAASGAMEAGFHGARNAAEQRASPGKFLGRLWTHLRSVGRAPFVRRAQARSRCHPPHLSSPQWQLSFERSAALRVCRRQEILPQLRHGCWIFLPWRTIRRRFLRMSPTPPGFRSPSAHRFTSAFSNRRKCSHDQTERPRTPVCRTGPEFLASALGPVPGSHEAVCGCGSCDRRAA
jgi:tetratricopeptide (TPR) repeat protein